MKRLLLPLFLLFTIPAFAYIDQGRVQECKGKPTAAEMLKCFSDSAKEDNTLQYCAYFNDWPSTKTCIERRNQVRRVSPKECGALEKFSEQCTEYVRSGVAAPEPEKITLETCNEDDMDGYCWWELAAQDKNFVPCSFYENQGAFMECFEGVAKLRKPTQRDCEALERHKDYCLKRVEELG